MVSLFDVCPMPMADEYIVRVVRNSGYYKGIWREYRRYDTRAEAQEDVERLVKWHSDEFRIIGIEPHVKEAGIFQTSPLQVVWRA